MSEHDAKSATMILAALDQAMDVLCDQIDDDEAWAAFSACHRASKLFKLEDWDYSAISLDGARVPRGIGYPNDS